MDIRKIRELIRMMESSSLTELTLKDSDMEISLSKVTAVGKGLGALPARHQSVPAALPLRL